MVRSSAEGYHHQFGEAHAVNAIADALKSHPESILSDATLYVSLEPCSPPWKDTTLL